MKAFTLIEVLLSLTIIAVLTAFTLPILQTFQTRNDLDIGINTISQNLRRAQTLSQAVSEDSSWGVQIQSGSITLFKGTTYTGRDTSYDELFDLPTSIAPTGLTEIVFSKLNGFPQTAGTVTLTLVNNSNETRTITINAKGTIN